MLVDLLMGIISIDLLGPSGGLNAKEADEYEPCAFCSKPTKLRETSISRVLFLESFIVLFTMLDETANYLCEGARYELTELVLSK